MNNEKTNIDLIGKFLIRKRMENGSDAFLSKQTADDLDIDAVFDAIDNTSSSIGHQYLYYKLHCNESVQETFAENLADLRQLEKDSETTKLVREKFKLIDNYESYYLTDLFWDKIESKRWIFKIGQWFLILFLIQIVIACFYSSWIPVVAISLLLNIIFYAISKQTILIYFWSLKGLKCFLKTIDALKDTAVPLPKCNAQIAKLNQVKGSIMQWLRFVEMETGSSSMVIDEITSSALSIVEYLKLFFLVEFVALIRISKFINKHADLLKDSFEAIGYLDYLLSIIALREKLPVCSTPEFSMHSNQLCLKNACHPLIENCIPNDIMLNNNAIVTGPNMSGKTTLLRTIAINTLLGKNILTCLATEATIPYTKIITSVNIKDSILEAESYYLAEVKRMYKILKALKSTGSSLILIDEIFSGTNALERYAAGSAILGYLSKRNCLVVVTSHDQALINQLSENYTVLNFEVDFSQDKTAFNYKLQAGKTTQSNAIRLLKDEQFPEEIVLEAEQFAGDYVKNQMDILSTASLKH